MANAIDGFFISAGLDDSAFEKGLSRMQSSFSNTVKNITNLVSGPLTAAFGAFASGAVVTQYLNQADAIGKMSDSLNIDIEELQAWGEAASRAGGSASAFQSTVQGINQRLQEVAKGGGEQFKQTLESLGVSATDTEGKTRGTLDVLSNLAEKAEGIDKEKFVGLAKKLGVDQGTIMLLQSGKVALEDLIKRQKEIGVYTKEDAQIAAQANDALADLQQSLKAAAAVILRHIVPPLTKFTDMIRTAVVFVKNHQPFFLISIGLIATAISTTLVPALIKMASAAWAAMAPFLPFILAGIALALVLDDLITYCEGGESAFEELWSIFGTGEEITNSLKNAWDGLKEVGKSLFSELLSLARAFIVNFEVLFSGIGDIISGIFHLIKGVFKGDLDEIYDAFVSIFTGIGKSVYGILEGVARTIISIFTNIVKTIEALFEKLFGKIKAVWDKAKEVIGFFKSDSAQEAMDNQDAHILNIQPSSAANANNTSNKTNNINAQQTNNITVNAVTDDGKGLGQAIGSNMNYDFYSGLVTEQMR